MMRVDGLRSAAQRWMLVSAVGAFMLACDGSCGESAPTLEGGAIHKDLISEAVSNYTFGPERKALPVDTTIISGPGGRLPTITISTSAQKSAAGRVPSNHFVYKLRSSAAYPTLGLAPGDNYVWRDTSAGSEGPYRTLVVPKDTAYPMMWLYRDNSVTSYAPLPAIEPRLVMSVRGFGACDNNCVPHCATKEALRTFAAGDSIKLKAGP